MRAARGSAVSGRRIFDRNPGEERSRGSFFAAVLLSRLRFVMWGREAGEAARVLVCQARVLHRPWELFFADNRLPPVKKQNQRSTYVGAKIRCGVGGSFRPRLETAKQATWLYPHS